MKQWLRRLVAILVLGTAFAAGRWTHAQAPSPAQAPPAPPQAQAANIVSGSDIGFRVDQFKGRTPVGTWVVRVNGQWVEPDSNVTMKRLTAK